MTTAAPDLERRLRARQPALRFVSERQLNRVLAAMARAGVRGPMSTEVPFWLDRADAERFGVPAALVADAGPRVLLLTPPDDRLLFDLDDESLARAYHRLLDRAEIAAALHDRAAWPDDDLARRFHTLADPLRREIRFVLTAEQRLPAEATEAEVCRAFLPLYRELAANRPDAIPDFFPLLAAANPALDELLRGVPDLTASAHEPPVSDQAAPDDVPAVTVEVPQAKNLVRAAITYYRRPEDRGIAVAIVRDRLAGLMGEALRWDAARTTSWRGALTALLPHTVGATWTPATKALYELQALALDRRARLFAVTPVEWLRSGGRRPMRQPLDKARDAILLRHLAKAHKQIDAVPLAAARRHELEGLIEDERHAAEDRIRETLGPIIRTALVRAGLEPRNRVEQVALAKLIAELLDQVCARGFFRFSDLRDALARNDLKLTDLSGPREWLTGDALLRADRELAADLFGIYQHGEAYLRGIQRISAAAFGTPPGRLLTLFILLPFLGAFLTLEFVQHVLHAVLKVAALAAGGHREHGHGPHLVTWWSLPLLGGFYLLLLNSPAVRREVWRAVRTAAGAVGAALVTLPRTVWASRVVQAVVRNPVAVFLWQTVTVPLAIGVGAFGVAVLYDLRPHEAVWVGAAAFVAALVVLRSPTGQRLYEQLTEGVLDMGRYVWASLIPGVVSWIVWAFREVAAAVEQVLYAVDEWLRFREGQSKGSLAAKTVAAVLWFPVAYVVRFVFYLLVEPQVNPVKHFPVVTVSHKVIWPMLPQIARATGLSDWSVAMILNGVPGVFGFIAWELKENWRLYEANRSGRLEPVGIGHHGETVRGLLRPGFHSGTVPKIYRRLRLLRESPTPVAKKLARAHHELVHVAEAVRHFVERELLPLLAEPGVTVTRVTVGCQRIEVAVEKADPAGPLVLAWELLNGEVVADLARRGWLGTADDARAKAILTAVAGLNAKAAVRTPELMAWADWAGYWKDSALPDGRLPGA